MAPKKSKLKGAAFNKETGYVPSVCREQLQADVAHADKTVKIHHSEKLPNPPPAQSNVRFYKTDPKTRRFLKDIALLFSKERSGRRVARELTRGRGQRSKGPAYVSATILSAGPSKEGEYLLTLHVALNGRFDLSDSVFAGKLAKFLNRPRCMEGDGRGGDVWWLAKLATKHCHVRFESYVADAQTDLEACKQNVLGLNCMDDKVRFQLLAEYAQKYRYSECTGKETIALRKLSNILRACRRIVHFRDSREGMLSGCFEIKQVGAKHATPARNVHCEAKLVHECLSDKVGKHVFDFIGCSKLSCLRCWYNINTGSHFITDDTTGRCIVGRLLHGAQSFLSSSKWT